MEEIESLEDEGDEIRESAKSPMKFSADDKFPWPVVIVASQKLHG